MGRFMSATRPSILNAVVLSALFAVVMIDAGTRGDQAEIAAAVQRIVQQPSAKDATPAVWADVRTFYAARGGSPAWTGGRLERADEALHVVRRAFEHGLVASDYDEPALARRIEQLRGRDRGAAPDPDHAQQSADLDVRLTTALLALGRDVAIGRGSPERADVRWRARRAPPDLPGTLNAAAANGLASWLDAIRPVHPEYAALQKALAGLHALQKRGGWPNVPGKPLKPGATGRQVEALRARLTATGELTGDALTAPSAGGPSAYDASVEDAVRRFQERHGLKPTGLADAATLAEMNVPIGARLQQVAINLNRWRWMPDDLGARHIFVNIPSYSLAVREAGRTVLSMRVIVGQADGRHHTPIFSAMMTSVVFSPYWNIPDTIADGEIAPAVARDPAYLARQNIDVLRVTGGRMELVDPSTVNWDDPQSVKHLVFRQRPGAANALGHVKFLLPNPFNVYLHDTPADHLFARPGRALSHGCVRLEQPEALARYVLRDQPEWGDAQIAEAMHAGIERTVKLKQPLPVHTAYFTAWVDEHGVLHFFRDVYRYDAAWSRGA